MAIRIRYTTPRGHRMDTMVSSLEAAADKLKRLCASEIEASAYDDIGNKVGGTYLSANGSLHWYCLKDNVEDEL